MKSLIPMDDYGVFVDKHDTARVDSRYVAQFFEKQHKHVLHDIAKLTEPKSGLSEEFRKANFMPSSYKDSTGRKLNCYLLTRDGFTLLAMGYTGQKAMQFKVHTPFQRDGVFHQNACIGKAGISSAYREYPSYQRQPEALSLQQ